MNSSAHQEKHFQRYIVERLVAQGWKLGETKHYDTECALYPEDLEAWIKTSGQKDKWGKLERLNGTKTLEVVKERLTKALEQQGTVQVLRQGLSIAGCGLIEMTETAPEDKRNEAVIKRYKANILRVVPELKYHPAREFAIDLVFFINGLPVATVELKTDFTQSAEAAMEQYRQDRLPFDPKTKRKEPLLTFKRGAVVHFAMSDSEIMMATKLDGVNTFFLPFNKGHKGRAGNPPGEKKPDGSTEYPVAYFWEAVCQPDAWLRIFHSFVYVEKKDVVDIQGNWSKKETLIFPRFHQWTAVNDMIADARKNGAGMTYLADHSAGSGKTSTISWTAHDLVKLRRDNGDPVFNSVIIVTDRNVLDGQLQDAVKQIDHQFGVIAAIDRQKSSQSKSKQLSDALINGTPIVVVTIQTFPYAMEAVITDKALKGKSFAVIIDEAHNSQTGTAAAKLQTALGMSGQGKMSNMTVDELLEQLQKSRARPDNISYFAFTGTPKHATLMLFGRPEDTSNPVSKKNPPEAFHKYTMRQAIEEGFILDVLKGYVPYQTAFNLSKQLEDSKRVSGKAAKRALAQWMALHPTNVTQKVQFIVEHFSKNVAHRLDGKAKAMVVTSSRAAAIRYKKAFDRYIEQHSEYGFIKTLVAFSGKMTGKQVMHNGDETFKDDVFIVDENEEFTEQSMNPDVQGQDLRFAFDRPEYRVMLVADKFQTGFDQPKLVAMYVDKKIANHVEIVQTFSRLNRMAPGKDEVFIIDFVNDPENVRYAFSLYDDGANIDDVQDLNIVYEIKERLDEHSLYSENELAAFKEARFKTIRDITHAQAPQHKALYAATEGATRLYNDKMKMLRDAMATWEAAFEKARAQGDEAGMKSADHHQDEYAEQITSLLGFKSDLGRFCRTYSYVAQLIDFGDPELENFAAFAKLLQKRLHNETPETVDLKGLVLTGFDIKGRTVEPVEEEEKPVLEPVGPGGGSGAGDKPKFVKEIIERLNSLFGEATPIQDQVAFVNQIKSIASESDVVMAQVESNTREQAMKGNLPGAVQQAVVRALSSHQKLATQVLKSDRQGMTALVDVIYELIRDGKTIDPDLD
ncbi:MAG: type I restriction endonuclease subunit R [Hahellaceae bacterium]|nr:type I restriction endonuclease subunit R [Hahellaceae bacterium]MCP5168718.1 type I restriction endonuclease subunit R [Hahellaceae bacterium]